VRCFDDSLSPRLTAKNIFYFFFFFFRVVAHNLLTWLHFNIFCYVFYSKAASSIVVVIFSVGCRVVLLLAWLKL